jgi:SAM-dependent methyltransferase
VGTSRRRAPRISPRQLLTRHLVGSGIEVGPGLHPFEISLPGIEVRYVDRWKATESKELFPQLAGQGEFAEPDLIADFNIDRLAHIPDHSQDFVIASHVLEHLAEPIGFIADIHRVLRPGGVALILLPDRHRTRDHNRPATPLSHLVGEFESGVQEVSEAHLVELLESRQRPLGSSGEERQETLDWYRKRSIHVHCWDASEFLEVILWGIEAQNQEWQFVDGSLPTDEFPPGIEFGLVIQRSTVSTDPGTRRHRFETAWWDWNKARIPSGMTPLETRIIRAYRYLWRAERRMRNGLGARLPGSLVKRISHLRNRGGH